MTNLHDRIANAISRVTAAKAADEVLSEIATTHVLMKIDAALAEIATDAQYLHDRFAKYIEDDNDRYRRGDGEGFDGKDAGLIGEFSGAVLRLLADFESDTLRQNPTPKGL